MEAWAYAMRVPHVMAEYDGVHQVVADDPAGCVEAAYAIFARLSGTNWFHVWPEGDSWASQDWSAWVERCADKIHVVPA